MSALDRNQLLRLIDPRVEIKFKQNECTTLVRYYDRERHHACIEKSYSGIYGGLEAREMDLMFTVANKQAEGQELSSRIATLHRFEKLGSALPGREVRVKWYGFDLDDWFTLVGDWATQNGPLHQTEWWLDITRSTLKALHLLHAAGMVHSDVHPGNLCLPFQETLSANAPGPNGQGAWRELRVKPDDLKLIDLGLSLKPRAERGLTPRAGNGTNDRVITLNPHMLPPHPRRLLAAYERAKTGDESGFLNLDWRIDLWRLGETLAQWEKQVDASDLRMTGGRALRQLLSNLCDDLRAPERELDPSNPSKTPAALPHKDLIQQIDDLLGPPKTYTFKVHDPAASSVPKQNTITPPARPTVQDPPLKPGTRQQGVPPVQEEKSPPPRWTPKHWAMGGGAALVVGTVALLGANGKLPSFALFDGDTAPPAASAASTSSANAQTDSGTSRSEAYQAGQRHAAYGGAGAPVLVSLPMAQGTEAGTLLGQSNGGADDEKPAYRVKVPYKLAMAETELTKGQFAAFVNDQANGKPYQTEAERNPEKGCWQWAEQGGKWQWLEKAGASWRNPGYAQTDQDPVVCVSFNDAQEYLKWANKKAGLDPSESNPNRLRLPTESEWEYAARAGSDGEYSLGANNSAELTTAKGNYSNMLQKTVAVKSYEANKWGLFDMHGNVWEWTQDCYNAKEYEAKAKAQPWDARQMSAGSDNSGNTCNRVLRGGSWNYFANYLRSAYRYDFSPSVRFSINGLRLARTLP